MNGAADEAMPGYVGWCSTCAADVPVYRAGDGGTVAPGSICCSRCSRVLIVPGRPIALVTHDDWNNRA